jgi:NAD(P)-dependent dehydrogenase (short-subunit alcohol dehydrogenase family)
MTVMVTGSGRGIGQVSLATAASHTKANVQAIAKAFAQAGASRLVLTARSQNELQSTFDSIRNDQHILVAPAILMFPLDITSDVAVKQMFSDLDAQDWPLEVLVNNAGHMERCLNIHFSDPTEWWKTWEVNVKGTYLTTHNALKAKLVSPRKEPLTIINVSSSAALMVKPGFSAYQCSKSAQTRFTEFIHAEYAHHNVRTFCFQPGEFCGSIYPVLIEQVGL